MPSPGTDRNIGFSDMAADDTFQTSDPSHKCLAQPVTLISHSPELDELWAKSHVFPAVGKRLPPNSPLQRIPQRLSQLVEQYPA